MNGRHKEPLFAPPSKVRLFVGGFLATLFALMYFVAPFYIISAIVGLIYRWKYAYVFAFPLLLSAILPPIPMPRLIQRLSPMLDYFEYEEIHESGEEGINDVLKRGKNYLMVLQPHGVISYVSICCAISTRPEFQGKVPSAVADAILYTPILKHVLGIFGIVSASKTSLKRVLQKPGVDGCVVLSVGGIAELFLSDTEYERLYLKSRKGFIKLALETGVDIVPVYLFGNTMTLSILSNEILASLSRKLQVSLTYIWGRCYLPIPRRTKLLYVAGKPLGMPKNRSKPTHADIEFWHAEYCRQVERIFEEYKEKLPDYKHKKLEIV
jgi:2-acylglycerol O-acyltransferase 2